LKVRGGLQNTKALPFPIPRQTKRQIVLWIQNPSVSRLGGKEYQPAEPNNSAIEGLRFVNDVIGFLVYADLLATEESLFSPFHIIFLSHQIVLLFMLQSISDHSFSAPWRWNPAFPLKSIPGHSNMIGFKEPLFPITPGSHRGNRGIGIQFSHLRKYVAYIQIEDIRMDATSLASFIENSF
jgi:hypothetical protein